MRILVLLLFTGTCFGQLTHQSMQPFFNGSSTAARWLPTNPTNSLVAWAELTPINGTWGPTSATHPAADNTSIVIWTNYSTIIGSVWSADQALHPTNFVSGGGGNGTSPRILFTAATPTRMVGPKFTSTTNLATFIVVVNCTATTGTDGIMSDPGAATTMQYNAKKLEMSQGTTISSAATMGTGYYVITFIFAAGASSRIDTNGVNMVTGNAGTGNLFLTSGMYLGQIGSAIYHGNMCRIWGWYGVLNATDISNAVAQCRTDFGI